MLELLLGVVAEHSADGEPPSGTAAAAEAAAASVADTDMCAVEEDVEGGCSVEEEEGREEHRESPGPQPEQKTDSTSEISVAEGDAPGCDGQSSEGAKEESPPNVDDVPAEIQIPCDCASSEKALPVIPPPVELGKSAVVARKPSADSLSARSSSNSSSCGAVLTRQRSSSVEGPVSMGTSALTARILTEHNATASPSSRRKRSTTSSQLERPNIAARSWNAILEEEKRENMSVVKSFGNYVRYCLLCSPLPFPPLAPQQQFADTPQRIGEMVGKGGYGKVYQGLNANTGELVAVKEVIMKDREFVLEQLPLILVCALLPLPARLQQG